MKGPKYPRALSAEAPRHSKRSQAFLPPPDPKYPPESAETRRDAKRPMAFLPPPDPKYPRAEGAEPKRTLPSKLFVRGPKEPRWIGSEAPKRPRFADMSKCGPKSPRFVGAEAPAPRT